MKQSVTSFRLIETRDGRIVNLQAKEWKEKRDENAKILWKRHQSRRCRPWKRILLPIRRFVGDIIEARRRHNTARHTAHELAQLPDYLKQDIDWPGTEKHEEC